MGTTDFRESTSPTPVDTEERHLLSKRISELAIDLEKTPLIRYVHQLYEELAAHEIDFRPKCYLADEWGCPSNVPVIGIAFYLASPELTRIESALTGLEVEDEHEIMMFMRHECGHAFNYAYCFYEEKEWTRLFGPYARPYHDAFRPDPFSDRFVRHIPGWYAQKHPDEDFAETFAVWLTPGSKWREGYADTPAMEKLLYVEKAVQRCRHEPPKVTAEDLDAPMSQIQETLAEWYKVGRAPSRPELPKVINYDLRTLFPWREGGAASDFLRPSRHRIIRQVYYWTGVEPHVLGPLVDELLDRIRALNLKVAPAHRDAALTDFAVLLTTLAMNYEYTGSFVKK
ncbi:MAG: putative zinc-binding metallopeptidase [bacterium]